jgi:hypothetical protein
LAQGMRNPVPLCSNPLPSVLYRTHSFTSTLRFSDLPAHQNRVFP